MKLLIGVTGAALLATASYFAFFKESPQEKLLASLTPTLGADTDVSLDECNVSIIAEGFATDGKQPALTRAVLRADLRNYILTTGHITPQTGFASLRFGRSRVDDNMMEQVEAVVAAGGEQVDSILSGVESIETLLQQEGSTLSFRVMVEIVSDDGKTRMIPHEDAPEFYEFASRVEALDAPASFSAITSYSNTEPSKETMLTGYVAAVPDLVFRVADQDAAQDLIRRFAEYGAKNKCY